MLLRSLLFVPGNNPAMLQNADVHGADGIILDLEDAVAPEQKDAARILVSHAVRALGFAGTAVCVRINPLDTPACARDIRRIAPLRPAFLVPPKVDGARDMAALDSMLTAVETACGLPEGTTRLMPIIETALGVENAFDIARAPRVHALLLGAEDYTSDLRAVRTRAGGEIAYARGRVLNAARAAQTEAIDTPFTDVNDQDGLLEDARLARGMGFTGKAAISPRHVADINAAFSPTQDEIAYARQVLEVLAQGEALGRGAVSLRGKMIDKPVVDRAKRVLDAARALGWEADA